MCCSGIAFAGIKGRGFSEDPGARHVIDFQAYAIRILEQNIVVAGCPCALKWASNNGGAHVPQSSSAGVDIFAGSGAKAQVVQSDTGLDKAFVAVFCGAGLDANRSTAANAIIEFVGVADGGHPHQRKKSAVKCPSSVEIGDGEDDMRHAVDFDAHRASD